MPENSPTTPLERPPDVNLSAALKILKEGSSKSERVSIPYDSAWNGLKMSPNPTKYITDTLAGFLSNPPDRLNQFAHALAGLVRFYKANPQELIRMAGIQMDITDKVNGIDNPDVVSLVTWGVLNTYREKVSDHLDFAIVSAFSKAKVEKVEEIRELQLVSQAFSDQIEMLIERKSKILNDYF